MPRILMFAPAFAPSYFSEALVSSKLALAMINRGWNVDVISMQTDKGPTYESGWPEIWKPLQSMWHGIEPVDPRYGFWRIQGLVFDVLASGHPVRGVHWAHMAYLKALEMHTFNNYDLVISRSTSCCAHLPAMMFKQRTGVTWIANWNDPPSYLFPPPYDYPISRRNRWLNQRYLRAAAKAADFNTFPSRRLYNHIQEELDHGNDGRARILPHIGLDGYSGTEWKKGDTLKFCHAGNLSSERRPELFLRALEKTIARYKGTVRINFENVGLENADLSGAITELNLQEHVTFLGAKSFTETMSIVGQCDVAVLIEAPCESGIFLPSKVIDYAQSGRPILSISPNVGVMRDLLTEHGGGIHADNLSQADIERAMAKLVELWLNNQLDSLNPKSLADQASPEVILGAIESMANMDIRGDTVNNSN